MIQANRKQFKAWKLKYEKKNKKLKNNIIRLFWFFLLTPAPPPFDLIPIHTIMDMRNHKRRNVLIHARVNFNQSDVGGELKMPLLLVGWGRGVNRKDRI